MRTKRWAIGLFALAGAVLAGEGLKTDEWRLITKKNVQPYQGNGFTADMAPPRYAVHRSREMFCSWPEAKPDKWGNKPVKYILVFIKGEDAYPFKESEEVTKAWFQLEGGERQAEFLIECGLGVRQLLDRNEYDDKYSGVQIFVEYENGKRGPHEFDVCGETYDPQTHVLAPTAIQFPEDYKWEKVKQ